MTYDLSKEPNSRVDPSKVFVLCTNCTIPVYEKLDPNTMYKVLMTDFLYDGGDGYDMLKGLKSTSLGI